MKRLLTLALLAVPVTAQRSDTIWQQLTNTSVSPQSSFVTLPVNNIGQTGHTVFVTVSGTFCSPSLLDGGLYYSWDNVTYYPFGNQVYPNTTNSITLTGTGAYPFVIVKFTYQSCSAQAFYTGTITPSAPYVQGTLPINTTANTRQTNGQNFAPQPVVDGSVWTYDASNGGDTGGSSIGVNVESGSTVAINTSTGTTTLISNTNGASRVYIGHLDVTVDTASTTVTLKEGLSSDCSSNTLNLGIWLMNPGQSMNVGKIRTQVLGDKLCISSSGGATKGSITYGVMMSAAGGQ